MVTQLEEKVPNLQEKLELIKLSDQGMSHIDISHKKGIPHSTASTILETKALTKVKGNKKKNVTLVHTKDTRKEISLIGDMKKKKCQMCEFKTISVTLFLSAHPIPGLEP